MFSPMMKQWWIGIGSFLNFFCSGLEMSYATCLLPGLRAAESNIKTDLDTESWLASVSGITMIFGFLGAPVFMERYGRRWVFASSSLILTAAWLTIYWAPDVTTLILGRMISGIAIGTSYSAGCTALAEYTAPEIRGLLLNIKSGILYSGYLFMHIVGHYFHWRTVALLSTLPLVLSFLNNLTWPESPSWLAAKNRFEECGESFFWLRGHCDKSAMELEAIVQAQKLKISKASNTMPLKRRVVNFFNQFKQKTLLKPLAIMFCCCIVAESSGRHFFPAYAIDIIMEITNDHLNSLYYIIGVDILSLLSATASCVLIKIVNRKSLLFFSGLTSIAMLIIIALATFVSSRGFVLIGDPWVVPALVGVFFVMANLGCTAIPYVIYGEIFPTAHREAGAGLGGAFMAICLFLYTKFLPYILRNLKVYGTFIFLAAGLSLSLLYLYFAMPETRNRTLQEIEDFFEHGRFMDDEKPRSSDELNEDKYTCKENYL